MFQKSNPHSWDCMILSPTTSITTAMPFQTPDNIHSTKSTNSISSTVRARANSTTLQQKRALLQQTLEQSRQQTHQDRFEGTSDYHCRYTYASADDNMGKSRVGQSDVFECLASAPTRTTFTTESICPRTCCKRQISCSGNKENQ
mmetsp:Transcript_86107/g.174838  ORF Transcript_86107/g.174838 Transcript_86107/m.174838 type:complete len:145 (-) Transcript_86107:2328-2762(-)